MSSAAAETETPEAVWKRIHAGHPRFREAVIADALITLRYRGEGYEFRGRLHALREIGRLALVSDAFLAHMLYRAKARLQALGVPILPRIAHRLAMAIAQVAIGDPVVMHAGVYIAHGQTVIDGITEIRAGVVIAPFTTVGLRADNLLGPTIENDVMVGTGARVLGPLRVGAGAVIGANAVVIRDVPAGATVVGAPARPL